MGALSLAFKEGKREQMRFMIIIRATAETEAEPTTNFKPDEKLMADMVAFHEEMAQAGVLREANGLQPSSRGWRIKYSGGKRTVVDGPFTEVKELIGGYTIIEVNSREEALEWSKRYPNPMGETADAEIEVRQIFDLDDFAPSEGVDRFRKLDTARGQ